MGQMLDCMGMLEASSVYVVKHQHSTVWNEEGHLYI